MKVWIYFNVSRPVGDVYQLKVFASEASAKSWFAEHDPEGVAFPYDVEDYTGTPAGSIAEACE